MGASKFGQQLRQNNSRPSYVGAPKVCWETSGGKWVDTHEASAKSCGPKHSKHPVHWETSGRQVGDKWRQVGDKCEITRAGDQSPQRALRENCVTNLKFCGGRIQSVPGGKTSPETNVKSCGPSMHPFQGSDNPTGKPIWGITCTYILPCSPQKNLGLYGPRGSWFEGNADLWLLRCALSAIVGIVLEEVLG